MTSGGFTDLVGCRLPLQLASLGDRIGTPALAAAVSDAGGLGMIPNPSSGADVASLVEAARASTAQPLGIGFLVPFLSRDALDAAARSVEVVEFFYGDPVPDVVRVVHGGGAVAGWQVGSVAEARAAAEAGCDYVVVQGIEAGGHVRGTERLDDLLAETLDALALPVVAAGGVGTGERAAELITAGAAAVRAGTRFVAAEESDAHPVYVAMLIDASAGDTVLCEDFSTGWPDAPHRVLRAAAEAAARLEGSACGTLGDQAIPPFAALPPTVHFDGEIGAMALYAGLSVDAVTRVEPAAGIVRELTARL